jgi:hypothetical protein
MAYIVKVNGLNDAASVALQHILGSSIIFILLWFTV